MITRRDVAARAGVSVATVSNVLNKKGIVQPDTEKRVYRAVEELGYIPDETARNLSLGRLNISAWRSTNDQSLPYGSRARDRASGFGKRVSCDGLQHRRLRAEQTGIFKRKAVRRAREFHDDDVQRKDPRYAAREKYAAREFSHRGQPDVSSGFARNARRVYETSARSRAYACGLCFHDRLYALGKRPRGVAYLDHLRTYGFENRSEYVF